MKNDLFAKIIIISGLIPIVLLTFTTIFYSENKLFENLFVFLFIINIMFYWGNLLGNFI